MIEKLPAERLRSVCPPEVFTFETTREVPPLDTIIGQKRAVRALEFGLGIQEKGYNIFVAGAPGTGKTTAVRRFLEVVARQKPAPDDWCYVNNFADPHQPTALRLPPANASEFKSDMHNLLEAVGREIGSTFESEEYANHREETTQGFNQQKEALFESINQKANLGGFLIQATPMGLMTLPMQNGKPLREEQYLALSPEERTRISERQQAIQNELEGVIRQVKLLDKESVAALRQLDRQVGLYAIGPLLDELHEKHHAQAEVRAYLEAVRSDILDNLTRFRAEPDQDEQAAVAGIEQADLSPRDYEINVLVSQQDQEGAPVVLEMNPTYSNLFGLIEQEARFGALTTDFTLIRPGALHRANGGYLVLPVDELVRNPFSWNSLKRALENGEIVIESAGERLGFLTTKTLQPEPIPLDVKVILIGMNDYYHLLDAYDETFRELFKVKAEFDTRMGRTPEHIEEYAAFVSTLCTSEGLVHLDRTALARLVEHGSRLTADQERLSTHFGELSDVVREASHYAAQEQAEAVSASHIQKAIDERFYRFSLVQERLREMIERGTIQMDITGEKVGQVNGLSVIILGDQAYGHPNRITASIGLGSGGLIDIEREANLGGPVHTKGVMILSGYFAEKFGQEQVPSMTARLVFEQSYTGVEGDSASSAELYALLSALSGLPAHQGIAVTGSINQKGEVQAISGVNEKIEGYFDLCKATGLTGDQGVMIPASNVQNLMLKQEVVQAVQEGQFSIWPVTHVEEGIELLTGVPAGAPAEKGFEPESVNDRVERRLQELSKAMSGAGRKDERPKGLARLRLLWKALWE